MKSYKKTVIAILLAVVLCSMACIEVFADHDGYSGYTDSPQYVTRQWGRDETQNLTSQFANPDSGNVGVYFYVTSFCMPDGFVRNTNRTITIMLMEEDKSSADGYEDDQVCKYIGTFGRDSEGDYRVISYERVELYPIAEIIEYAPGVELYIDAKVQWKLGDTTNNIPSGLLYYRYWID